MTNLIAFPGTLPVNPALISLPTVLADTADIELVTEPQIDSFNLQPPEEAPFVLQLSPPKSPEHPLFRQAIGAPAMQPDLADLTPEPPIPDIGGQDFFDPQATRASGNNKPTRPARPARPARPLSQQDQNRVNQIRLAVDIDQARLKLEADRARRQGRDPSRDARIWHPLTIAVLANRHDDAALLAEINRYEQPSRQQPEPAILIEEREPLVPIPTTDGHVQFGLPETHEVIAPVAIRGEQTPLTRPVRQKNSGNNLVIVLLAAAAALGAWIYSKIQHNPAEPPSNQPAQIKP